MNALEDENTHTYQCCDQKTSHALTFLKNEETQIMQRNI